MAAGRCRHEFAPVTQTRRRYDDSIGHRVGGNSQRRWNVFNAQCPGTDHHSKLSAPLSDDVSEPGLLKGANIYHLQCMVVSPQRLMPCQARRTRKPWSTHLRLRRTCQKGARQRVKACGIQCRHRPRKPQVQRAHRTKLDVIRTLARKAVRPILERQVSKFRR